MADKEAANPFDVLGVLQELGLSEKEARVVAALVAKGSAGAVYLAQEADVYRTNVYPILEGLAAKGLIGRFPGKAGAWSSSGRDKVIDRLYAAEENRHERLQASKEDLRAALTEPEEPEAAAVPVISLVHGPTDTGRVYDDMLRAARSEVVVFNRPPYGVSLDAPSDAVLSMLRRGVPTRVLYRAADLDAPTFRRETEYYLDAGVEARVSEELPTKLVVVDRRLVLVAVMEPDAEDGFPFSQHVDHAGFAAPWAEIFEHYWAGARPYADVYPPEVSEQKWSSSRDSSRERSTSSS